MGDTYRFPVALKWDEGPDSLRKVRNKLLLHFQSKNKSNGGECQIRELDCSRGYIVIHFRDESVRDQVLRRTSHEVSLPDGRTLALDVRPVEAAGEASAKPGRDDLIRSPAAKMWRNDGSGRAEPPRSNLVLIENLQDALTSEMLTLLIEHISDRSDDSEFYLERIPEKRAAVITFTCDIDVSGFIQEFSRNHRVNKQKLTATALEETRSVRAEGLPPSTEEDLLIMYLESPKLGAGQVQEVVMLPEEEAALVTFQDERSVEFLVGKEHVFSKKTICVYRYFPTIGIALYGRDGPRVVRPQPVQRPISPYLLEFIWKDPSLKQSMERNMADKMCEILWPDPQSSDPVITLSFPTALSSHLRTMVKVARTWTDQVSNEFSRLISRYRVIDCKMAPSAWEDIREQVSTPAYHGVLIKADADAEKVFLAGAVRDVNRMEQTFRDLVKESSRKAERSSRVTTMTEAMSAALYHIIQNSGLEKKILADVPELKMEYDPSTHNVLLTGLRDEVLQAKCEILSAVQRLRSKSIPLSPHVRQFLMVAGPEEVSCVLFVRHNINALMEVEENAIKLSGCSQKDLSDAEEQISRELIHQRIPVEDKNVLQSPEWRSLQSHLDSHNVETCTVMIQEFPPGAEGDVVVSGFSSHVQKTYKAIHEFVERSTPMQKTIRVPSMAVMQFLQEEKRVLQDLKQINVQVTVRKRNLALTGTKTYVEEASAHVQGALSSVHHDTLRISKPGAKKFCLANEEMYITMARNKYKCVIHLQRDEDDDDDEISDVTSAHAPQYQIQLPQGVTVSVHRGDLCRHNADVIVNAANEDLKHIGGLAMALLTAAGPKLQSDCDVIVRQQGRLFPGQSVITDAGHLPCKQVIHTVGPRWSHSSPQRCKDLLRTAIKSSLALAEERGHRSIAIPAVSSGIFGFPVAICVQNIVEAIKDFVEGQNRSGSVTAIHLVDTKDETIAAFTRSLKEQFGERNVPRYTMKKATESAPRQEGATASPGISGQEIVVRVEEGLLQDATTDVIVNSVGRDLRLDSGGASRALHEKAGPQLQASLSQEASGAPVTDGCTYVTPGGNLSCRIVIHVVVPRWDGGRGSSEEVFGQMIRTCLDTAERRGLRSITFPAVGTGNLGFPKSRAASLMFQEVLRFSATGNGVLQRVTFMLHPKDTETIKEFNTEQSARKSKTPAQSDQESKTTATAGATAFYGPLNTQSLGLYEMRVGSITYQVKTGDITKEDTDVIVNSTNKTFDLMSGVSRSILAAAGQGVVDECARLAPQTKKDSVITSGGNLLCKHILHIVGRNSAEGIKEFVKDSLQECETLPASSVALPAIGTGLGNVSAAVVADIILEGVADFARSRAAPSLQTVKVVVFQQPMLQDFYTSMKKKEGSDLPKGASLLSKIRSMFNYFTSKPGEEKEPKVFALQENIEPAIFHLCADNRRSVSDASSWLRDLILKEQQENIISDDWILEFDEEDHRSLSQDQRRLEVVVSFESPGSTVKISGLTRDVLEMTNKIQDLIKKVREQKSREREAELCSNLVEWRYHDGNKMVPFDRMTNLELETAKCSNARTLQIVVSGVTYTAMMERSCMRDPQGKEWKIERLAKHGQFELPPDWTPMSGDMMVVALQPGSPEYSDAEAQFKKTCQMRIVNIERIQNKNLWMNYQIKKQALDAKNGATANERRLFHGTDSNTIKNVNHNGFNRSYAGKNAACYGNGTYFAVNSNYSAQNQYSVPDTNGMKYMYLARVLTGEFCAGKQGMVAPPAKNSTNTTDLYDSVSDNVANPSIFVIFHDIQAYPEYLITFSK